MTSHVDDAFLVIGFASAHDALEGEALLADMGIEVVPVPAPKAFGALCGIALRVPSEQSERALRYLENGGIPVAGSTRDEDA